jgi:hypothetical protein
MPPIAFLIERKEIVTTKLAAQLAIVAAPPRRRDADRLRRTRVVHRQTLRLARSAVALQPLRPESEKAPVTGGLLSSRGGTWT